MALILKTNTSYLGNPSELPPATAPLPAGATLYADFLGGFFINETDRGSDPSRVFDTSQMRARWVRQQVNGDLALAPEGSFTNRIEYDIYGPLGLLVESYNENHIPAQARADLTVPTVFETNVVVAAGGGSPSVIENQWWDIEPAAVTDRQEIRIPADQALPASNRYMGAEFWDLGESQKFVQISNGDFGTAEQFANFNLRTGEVTRQGLEILQAFTRKTVRGWECWIEYAAGAADAIVDQYTVSIISDPQAGKRPDTTLPSTNKVRMRFPKLTSSLAGLQIGPLSPMPGATSPVLPDRLFVPASTLAPAAYSVIARGKTSYAPRTSLGSLFALCPDQAGSDGMELRYLSTGNMGVVVHEAGSSSVVHEFNIPFRANQSITAGLRKSGTEVRVTVEEQTYVHTSAAFEDCVPFVGTSPFRPEQCWDGHLEMFAAWPTNLNQAKLDQIVRQYA